MLRLFKILGFGVLGLVGLLGLGIGALHFSAVGDKIGSVVGEATNGEATLEGLRLSGGLNVRIDHVRYQPQGAEEAMVEARKVALDWSPLALLGGTAKINTIRIAHLRYADVAVTPGEPAPEETGGGGLPQLPVSIDLHRLEIEALELAAPSLGLQSRYSLAGQARVDAALREAVAEITGSRQDADGALAVSIDYGADRDRIKFSLLFEDADGAPLAAFTGFDGGALSVKLEGEGPLEKTDQSFLFEMANGPKAQGQWSLSYDEALGIEGRLTVEPRGFGGPDVASYAGESVTLSFNVGLEDQELAARVSTSLAAPQLQTRLEVRASGSLDDALGFDVMLEDLQAADVPPEFAPLQAAITGRFDLGKNSLTLEPSRITTANDLTLNLQGDIPLSGPVAMALELDAPALQKLAPGVFGQAAIKADISAEQLGLPARLSLIGTASVAMEEGGPQTPVEVKLKASVSDTMAIDAVLDLGVESLDGIAPDLEGSFTSKLEIKGSADAAQGVLHARATSKGEALHVKAPFGYNGATLTLTDLRLDGLGVEGAGNGAFALDSGTPQGALDLVIADLSALAALAGMDAAGAVQLKARLKADGTMAGEAVVQSLSLPAEGIEVKALEAVITPKGEALAFTLKADAQAPVTAGLDVAGTALLGDTLTIRLDRLAGIVNDIPLKLLAPAEFRQAGEELAVKGLNLAVAGGSVEGDAALGADQIAADIKLIGLTPPDTYTGGVSLPIHARLRATGSRAAPQVRLQAQTQIAHDGLESPVTASLDGRYLDQKAKALIALEGGASQFEARLDAPFALDLVAMTAELTGKANIKAGGKIALATLEPFMLGDGSRFTGFVGLEADGVADEAEWSANAKLCLTDAGVDLAATGTVVKGLKGCIARAADGSLSGDISAKDAAKGAVSARFEGSVLGRAPDAIKAAIALKGFRLMDSDLGIVEASSKLTLDAQLADGLKGGIDGVVTIDKGDLIIPGNPGPSFETIEVRHVGRPGDAEAEPEAAMGAPFGTDFRLDIVLSVPGNFFVRGRGLESEWEGGIDVTGTAAAPQIDGTIELKKGSANAGVSSLELTRGEIRLFTQKPGTAPVVLVRLESESNVEGTIARMVVEGPVEDPDVTFSSTPELPQDEILARLIFGKPASELSAVEAAQLGSAALTLSGALGGGPGVFDKLRRGLGVDRIAFDPSIDNPASSSVTVGKYVTPKVYVSVKQDASGAAPGIAVDYEVTRRVTLSAADDGAGGESAGVKYEFDY